MKSILRITGKEVVRRYGRLQSLRQRFWELRRRIAGALALFRDGDKTKDMRDRKPLGRGKKVRRVILVTICVLSLSVQGCSIRDERFDISSVTPKHAPHSYFRENPEIWDDLSSIWLDDGYYLALRVTMKNYIRFHDLDAEDDSPLIALIVQDCTNDSTNIYGPYTRYAGETGDDMYEYEKVIEYKRTPEERSHSYYDLFEEETELCLRVQTLEMGWYSVGNTYRLKLDADVRRIAEGTD